MNKRHLSSLFPLKEGLLRILSIFFNTINRAKIQIGVMKVVSNINDKEIPSFNFVIYKINIQSCCSTNWKSGLL